MKSLVRINAEQDPAYSPYCMRCPGLVRMAHIEPYYWRCSRCKSEHDERGENKSQEQCHESVSG